MADTATKRGRALQIEQYTKDFSWGPELNTGSLQRIDDMWGVTEVAVNANVTLTAQNFIGDQSRSFILILTGTGGFSVTTPAVDKPYIVVNNCAADITIKPSGGTAATVRAGTAVPYYTNAAGTVGYVIDATLDKVKVPAADVALNGKKITGLATPTNSADAVTKAYADTVNNAVAGNAAIAAAAATTATTQAGLALAAYDAFDDRYLGSKAADPTFDNDGDPLLTGALYWNSVAGQLRSYSGTVWVPIVAVSFATQSQAEAGVATGVAMDPLRVEQWFAARAHGFQEFLSSGSFLRPPLAKWVFVEVLGGGGGGASGARVAISTAKGGGGGGGGAPAVTRMINAADLAASETVTIGAGGGGGAVQTVNSTQGVDGTTGGTSSFGAWVSSLGGFAGTMTNAATGNGGNGRGWYDAIGSAAKGVGFEGPTTANGDFSTLFAGAPGGRSLQSVPSAASMGKSSVYSAGGGGGGGSEDNTNAIFAPSPGGTTLSYTAGGGAAAGVSHATASTAGASGSGPMIGGGGGGANQGAAASPGGAGGLGAGGGGGGASRNGFNSGAGGAGGAGRVRVWWG